MKFWITIFICSLGISSPAMADYLGLASGDVVSPACADNICKESYFCQEKIPEHERYPGTTYEGLCTPDETTRKKSCLGDQLIVETFQTLEDACQHGYIPNAACYYREKLVQANAPTCLRLYDTLQRR